MDNCFGRVRGGKRWRQCIGMFFWKMLLMVVTSPWSSQFSLPNRARYESSIILTGERLASMMKREKYVCGVNGGYFDEQFKPIGLRIVNSQMLTPLKRARLITGVLLASSRGVQIVRAREFSQHQKIEAAIQCGPFLVDRSQRVGGLNNSQQARRTFAATATNERALLGVCSEVSLADLAAILATTPIAADLKIQRALNLDGGSSSAFWFARENGSDFPFRNKNLCAILWACYQNNCRDACARRRR